MEIRLSFSYAIRFRYLNSFLWSLNEEDLKNIYIKLLKCYIK